MSDNISMGQDTTPKRYAEMFVTNAPTDYDYARTSTVRSIERPDTLRPRTVRTIIVKGDRCQINYQVDRYLSGGNFCVPVYNADRFCYPHEIDALLTGEKFGLIPIEIDSDDNPVHPEVDVVLA